MVQLRSRRRSVSGIQRLTRVALLSSAFCLVFMAFSAAQNFQTGGGDSTVGARTLSILYFTFTLSNLFIASAVRLIGSRISMFIGSLCYVQFVAMNMAPSPVLSYCSAFVIGIGASLMWTAQGVFVTESARDDDLQKHLPAGSSLGHFNGIFFAVFQLNQFLGNLLVALLFQYDLSSRVVFLVCTIVAAFGSFAIFLSTIPDVGNSTNESVVKSPSLTASMRLLLEPSMLLIAPFVLVNGACEAFIFGDLHELAVSNQTGFYMLSVFGASDALSSMLLGKISDRIGRFPVATAGHITHILTLVLLLSLGYNIASVSHPAFNVPLYLLVLVSASLGFIDAAYNTQAYAIMGSLFADSEAAFANLKLFQSLMLAAAFLYRPHTSLQQRMYIQLVLAATSAIGVGILHSRNLLQGRRDGTAYDRLQENHRRVEHVVEP